MTVHELITHRDMTQEELKYFQTGGLDGPRPDTTKRSFCHPRVGHKILPRGSYKMGDDRNPDLLEKTIMACIEHQRFAVVPVSGGKQSLSYAYSIGLYQNFSHPELIMFAADPYAAQESVNKLVHLVEHGQQFTPNRIYLELIDGRDCFFSPVNKDWYTEFVGRGIDFYGSLNFPLLRCLWA